MFCGLGELERTRFRKKEKEKKGKKKGKKRKKKGKKKGKKPHRGRKWVGRDQRVS